MATFRNPANGYTETTGIKTVIFGGLLGPLYYASIGAWGVVFITIFAGWPAIILLSVALIFEFTGIEPNFFTRYPDILWTDFGAKFLLAPLAASCIWAALMVPLVVSHYRRNGWEWVE
jgi:hypothetical protein